MRLLFASIHSFLDPSGGAALPTRELLELLAAVGFVARQGLLPESTGPSEFTGRAVDAISQ